MKISLIILLSTISIALCCKCKTQSTQESFCKSEWVSHLKVKVRVTKQALPSGSSRPGLNNIKYFVEHKHVYRKPRNVTELPNEIYTPSERPACGLVIEAGKEYLLAGRIESGVPFTVLCGQVLPDDSGATEYESVLEWQKATKMRFFIVLFAIILGSLACDIIVHLKSDTAKKFQGQITASNGKKSDKWTYSKKLEKNTFHQKADECGLSNWKITTFDESGKQAHEATVTLDGIGRVTYKVGDDLKPVQKDRQGAICKGECAPL